MHVLMADLFLKKIICARAVRQCHESLKMYFKRLNCRMPKPLKLYF